MPRGNPDIAKHAKGRPKGSKNRTPILMQEIEGVVFELPKEERLRRLRAYRDHMSKANPHHNYFMLHSTVAKRQEENGGQGDLFNDAEERALIENAERSAANRPIAAVGQ